MLVTVAICTRNRSHLLSQALESMKALIIPPDAEWELLVVNNNSTDATDHVIGSFGSSLPLRRLFEPKTGKSNALNLAAREARGEYILWTDDDCRPEPMWLAEHCRAFKMWPEVSIFGGPILPQFEGTPPVWLETSWSRLAIVYATRDFGNEPLPISRNVMPFGSNLAVRTTEQRKYLYDPRIGRGTGRFLQGSEETLLVQNMLDQGILGRWVPKARVLHYITKDRQTTGYLRRYFLGHGETLSHRFPEIRSGTKIGNKLLSNQPVSFWRYGVRKEICYRARRLFSTPKLWIDDLAESSTAWGIFFGLKRYKHSNPRIPNSQAQSLGGG